MSALSQRRLLLAGAAAWSISTLFSAMKPVLITRYGQELGTPAAWAALVAAVPFLGIAAASPLFGALRIRASVRTLGITVHLTRQVCALLAPFRVHLPSAPSTAPS